MGFFSIKSELSSSYRPFQENYPVVQTQSLPRRHLKLAHPNFYSKKKKKASISTELEKIYNKINQLEVCLVALSAEPWEWAAMNRSGTWFNRLPVAHS